MIWVLTFTACGHRLHQHYHYHHYHYHQYVLGTEYVLQLEVWEYDSIRAVGGRCPMWYDMMTWWHDDMYMYVCLYTVGVVTIRASASQHQYQSISIRASELHRLSRSMPYDMYMYVCVYVSELQSWIRSMPVTCSTSLYQSVCHMSYGYHSTTWHRASQLHAL
jgi:hypothetical protein